MTGYCSASWKPARRLQEECDLMRRHAIELAR
jgi:hypothetical protein